ncbi:EEF1A lysine methyltransferase 4-like isoform X2 [Ruditapes philippinarum]|nr:EEF1A lysine methyltransferase 4-like isoform X2 [Ruditapes philippinarum]XP_060574063.1 EEF1A lysine methyltransferase 4-like isoform X2 [Ruditapes philippinarum]XP_060574065.1 EEF1A lysine methyltransferase 4-like isoform X2 [Ruditapes philippinarum]
MEPPANNADYREQDYWDTRYQTEEKYDWFSAYSSFRHHLVNDVKPDHKILMLGCGNSSLSEEMYNDGYKHITNIDFSPIVIEKMRSKHSDLHEMTWEVMDICDLRYEPSTYDIVLEKGTLDALMVHEKDPWNTSTETLQKIDGILQQISRILKTGGKFISITFAQPHFRKPLYACDKFNWNMNISTFGNSFHFFYFMMEKGKQLSEKDRMNEIERQKRKQDIRTEKVEFMKYEDKEDFIFGIDL